MKDKPKVSICCLTYNHALFIKECMDGFLSQQTTFPVEILIHDDASTDGTDDILREYERKYPDVVFPLYEKVNRFSSGCQGQMDILFNYSRAHGKYIAYCEGDDYWTDPLKLQKQVDFMESHPEYSVCFHRCSLLNSETGKMTEDECGSYFKDGEVGVDLTLDMYFRSWVTQPLTMMFRRSSFSLDWCKRYKYYRDMHEIYHLLRAGKGYLFSFVGGVYRSHQGGISSQISKEEYCRVSLPMDKEFYRKTHEKQAKKIYTETLEDAVTVFAKKNKLIAIWYAVKHFLVSGKYRTFVKNIRIIFHG